MQYKVFIRTRCVAVVPETVGFAIPNDCWPFVQRISVFSFELFFCHRFGVTFKVLVADFSMVASFLLSQYDAKEQRNYNQPTKKSSTVM